MMTDMADHANPLVRRDRLWVLAVIAACALLEVWASWLSIGALAGFPKIGRMTTGWILPVTTEAYWGVAAYAWLADPAGHRSRRFAMWTAAGMFLLSLTGQEAGHLLAAARRTVPPAGVVMFVTALPLISAALAALLIHLRQSDREDAAEAARLAAEAERIAAAERAEADERTALRTALESAHAEREAAEGELRAALEAAQADLVTAQSELAKTAAKGEELARKLDAVSRRNAARNARTKKGAVSPRNDRARSRETEVPDDVDARAEALAILEAEPDISGAELGERVGKSKRWGQLLKSGLAATAAPTDIVDGKE